MTCPAIRQVLVVYKKSAYQIYIRERRAAHIARLIKKRSEAVRDMRRSDQEQKTCLATIRKTLKRLRLDATFHYRAGRFEADAFDLVISVGGDGTLLETSHHVLNAPVLGVNSAPSTSVGHFTCCAEKTFAVTMEQILASRLKATPLARIEVSLNGKVFPTPILNDALFAAVSPAATSRYILHFQGKSEEQKSSGIWLASAAGSTAAYASAGGRPLRPRSKRLVYLVREPYRDPKRPIALVGGRIAPGEEFAVTTKMRRSAVYLDGPHLHRELALGDRLSFRLHPNPLRLVGFSV